MADVIIIGGGLAGLTAGIDLSRNGVSVLLIEKEKYPHHKVCGEYLSREVLPYLQQLEIPIGELQAPEINRLLYSTAEGKTVEAPLPLGGLGISRYTLDDLFHRQALKNGVEIVTDTASSVEFAEDNFIVKISSQEYYAPYVIGAFGKRSGLDKKLERPFFNKTAPWLAVKAHYSNNNFPSDLVALHNFDGGYCGLSKTETGAVNVCYLAAFKSFKRYRNHGSFEEQILVRNPFLNKFFGTSTMNFDRPLSIAQISFEKKESVRDHILFAGDAAGLIHPLCGNGMAMAVHSAKIAAALLLKALKQSFPKRDQLEKEYRQLWNENFSRRMRTGKTLQSILLNQQMSGLSQRLVSNFPFLLPEIIKRTHGRAII